MGNSGEEPGGLPTDITAPFASSLVYRSKIPFRELLKIKRIIIVEIWWYFQTSDMAERVQEGLVF